MTKRVLEADNLTIDLDKVTYIDYDCVKSDITLHFDNDSKVILHNVDGEDFISIKSAFKY